MVIMTMKGNILEGKDEKLVPTDTLAHVDRELLDVLWVTVWRAREIFL